MGGSGRKSFWRRTCRSLPHDVQLFLGCTDPLTAEFVSDRTGLASVAVTSKSKHLPTIRLTDYTPEYRETSGVGKRPVLTPDEVLRLPIDEALIIARGQKPLKVNKYDYSIHPESSKLRNCKASHYIPLWRQEKPNKKPAMKRPNEGSKQSPPSSPPPAQNNNENSGYSATTRDSLIPRH